MKAKPAAENQRRRVCAEMDVPATLLQNAQRSQQQADFKQLACQTGQDQMSTTRQPGNGDGTSARLCVQLWFYNQTSGQQDSKQLGDFPWRRASLLVKRDTQARNDQSHSCTSARRAKRVSNRAAAGVSASPARMAATSLPADCKAGVR